MKDVYERLEAVRAELVQIYLRAEKVLEYPQRDSAEVVILGHIRSAWESVELAQAGIAYTALLNDSLQWISGDGGGAGK